MPSTDPSTVTAAASLVASLAAAGAALYSRAQQQDAERDREARAAAAEKEKEARMRAEKEADEERAAVSKRLGALEIKAASHDVELARQGEAHKHVSEKLDGIDRKIDQLTDAVLEGIRAKR